MIGSSVAIHSPTIAGSAPMPRRLIISASLPSVGIDVAMLTAWIAPSAQRAIDGRDSQMPSATPVDDRQRAGNRRPAPGAA